MCRLLMLEDPRGIDPLPHLDAFRELSRDSTEYQGHGWGCAWRDDHGHWHLYHNIRPVWEDPKLFPRTTLYLAHARSAFRDEGIAVENNMPFTDGQSVFIFNGELQGVRIKAEGRIGAEKIFNTVRRFDHGDLGEASRRAVAVINKRTRYVRAMNFILADTNSVQVCCQFSEGPDYFQLRYLEADSTRIVCSQCYDPRLGAPAHWRRLDNHSITTLTLKRNH